MKLLVQAEALVSVSAGILCTINIFYSLVPNIVNFPAHKPENERNLLFSLQTLTNMQMICGAMCTDIDRGRRLQDGGGDSRPSTAGNVGRPDSAGDRVDGRMVPARASADAVLSRVSQRQGTCVKVEIANSILRWVS